MINFLNDIIGHCTDQRNLFVFRGSCFGYFGYHSKVCLSVDPFSTLLGLDQSRVCNIVSEKLLFNTQWTSCSVLLYFCLKVFSCIIQFIIQTNVDCFSILSSVLLNFILGKYISYSRNPSSCSVFFQFFYHNTTRKIMNYRYNIFGYKSTNNLLNLQNTQ